jgi:hypothetical protein
MKLDLSGLYKYLKSEECSLFFQNVLPENKTEIIETILGNEEFLTTANQFVPDVAIIREQLGNFLSGILKKKTAVIVPLPVVEMKPDPIVFVLEEEEEEDVEETGSKPTKNSIRTRGLDSSWSMTDKDINPSPEGADLNLQRFKGTHVGNGIYLLREEHVIKMTTPDFVVYY